MIINKIAISRKVLSLLSQSSIRYFVSRQASKPINYYYNLFNLKPGFTQEELKSAYLEMVKKYHPDLSKQPNAVQKFQQIQAAYDYLQDPQKIKKQEMQYEQVKTEKQTKYKEEVKIDQEAAKQFKKKFEQYYSKKPQSDDSLHFSYGLYKKHYEQVQEKKMQYKKYHGQYRQQYAHKDEKSANNWRTFGLSASILFIVGGGITFVNYR